MQLKGFVHDNIQSFVGACIDPGHVCYLMQYCSRRTLQVGPYNVLLYSKLVILLISLLIFHSKLFLIVHAAQLSSTLNHSPLTSGLRLPNTHPFHVAMSVYLPFCSARRYVFFACNELIY